MHNHNNDNKNGERKGMWWMIIPCLLLLGFLFLGGGKSSSSGYLWPILIGVFVIAHIWMMFKGHGGRGGSDENSKTDASEQPETKNEHKHSGGCH